MSEDCPSCERYLHDHAEVFAELAALREKLALVEAEQLGMQDGAQVRDYRAENERLRGKCERLETEMGCARADRADARWQRYDWKHRAETYREGLERIAEDAHAKFCPVIWPFVCLPCIARETLEKGEKE